MISPINHVSFQTKSLSRLGLVKGHVPQLLLIDGHLKSEYFDNVIKLIN